MFANLTYRHGFAAVAIATLGGSVPMVPAPAVAEDAAMSAEAVYKDVEATLGSVPAFVRQLPKTGLAGAWSQVKALEFSGDTALTSREKSLIALAVSAQIPCQYCIWSDTNAARQAGATEEQIAEAVAVAAVTRQWSTIFNGLQVDFDQFKRDLGGDGAAK